MGRSGTSKTRRRRRQNRNHGRNRAARDHLRRLLEGRGIEPQMATDVATRVVEEHRAAMAFDDWLADEVAAMLWDAIQSEQAARDALRETLGWQAILHPLPWRIESDWTEEVIASDDAVIAKCRDSETAEAIIALAESTDPLYRGGTR